MNADPSQLPSGLDRAVITAGLPTLLPAAAFDWFTVPNLLTRWWPQVALTDGREGGRYALRWPAMEWELLGEYLEYRPGNLLVFTWRWTHRPDLPQRTVSVSFEPEADGARVTVDHGTYGESAEDQADRQGHIDGWLHFLGRLRAASQPA